MNIQTPSEHMREYCRKMGMQPAKENPYEFGEYFVGDGTITKGFLWFFSHEEMFVITKCHFIFTKDCYLHMPENFLYIALRMDYANFGPSGKVLSFMEQEGKYIGGNVLTNTKVHYSEILYFPPFYQNRLISSFDTPNSNPVEILKAISEHQNWPLEIRDTLTSVHLYPHTGISAQLFYIAKAYELLAELINMGKSRLPKNTTDYEKLLHVIHYIDQHFKEEIRQKTLVLISNMSATKLKTNFKQLTGKTITTYILEKKNTCAIDLLTNSDAHIDEIARILGFETATGFSTSFKKLNGLSPTQFRQQLDANCIKNPSINSGTKYGWDHEHLRPSITSNK